MEIWMIANFMSNVKPQALTRDNRNISLFIKILCLKPDHVVSPYIQGAMAFWIRCVIYKLRKLDKTPHRFSFIIMKPVNMRAFIRWLEIKIVSNYIYILYYAPVSPH